MSFLIYNSLKSYSRFFGNCFFTIIFSIPFNSFSQASFIAPDTVCVNELIQPQNTTPYGNYYSWNFCSPNVNNTSSAVNIGNPGGMMNTNVMSDMVVDSSTGNYYMFATNYFARTVIRLDFGNSPLNVPTSVNLGNVGGVLPPELAGIQIANDGGNWYGLIVGGQSAANARLVRLDFGASLTNAPTAINHGNIGTMTWPHGYQLVNDGGNWFGIAANRSTSRITVHDFGNSLLNIPTGTTTQIVGPTGPCNVMAIKDGGNWHVFATCLFNGFVRLDYGNSLNNVPTQTNYGTLNGNIQALPRAIIILKDCNQYVGYLGHENGNTLKLNFPTGLTGAITVTNLNNISGVYQKVNDYTPITFNGNIYIFTCNYQSNNIQRMDINFCASTPVPASNNYHPPAYSYGTAGIYDISLITDEGRGIPGVTCKKIYVVNSYNISQNASICNNQSYTLPGGSIVNTTGVYNDTLSTISGCDSIITTNLTVAPPITSTQNPTICKGQSFTLPNGSIVNSAGTYTHTLTTSGGCDSVITTNLTIAPALTGIQNPTICKGQNFTLPGGALVNTSGVYYDSLVNSAGCDSVVTTNLTVAPALTGTQNPTICKGQNYTLPGGAIVNTSGVYYDSIVNSAGCDSIVTTNLTIAPALTGNLNPNICTGQNFTLPGGSIVNTSGTYLDTIKNGSGCDSIVTTNLLVANILTSSQSSVLCAGASYTRPSGAIATASGVYLDTLTAIGGCDSVITTSLLFNPNSNFSQSPKICADASYTLPGGTIVTAAGTYLDTLKNVYGCDSIITTNLNVIPLPIATTSANVNIEPGDTTTLIASGDSTFTWFPTTYLSAATGSIVIANPPQTTTYCVEVKNSNNCKDTACVTVTVELNCLPESALTLPNAFSPNNDNVNDEFCLQGWKKCIKEFTVVIYNRWGEKVFESDDADFCWNGNNKNNTPCDAQVFVYTIKARFINIEKPIIKNGNITLIK